MKVQIKGLVFVGFAAAIFAANAMAAEGDSKIVTSKNYVDGKVVGVSESGTAPNITYGASTITANSPNDKAPSAQNVYKFVTGQVGSVDVIGDNTYTKAAKVASGADAGKFKVELQQTPVLASGAVAGLTGTLTGNDPTKLVTAGAVNALIETSAISNSSTETKLATSKKVYDYAEAKANKLAAGSTTGGTIGSNAGDDTKFPTVKNVAQYVTSSINTAGANYQPKINDTDDHDKVMIGYNKRTGAGTSESPYVYDSNWQELGAGTYVQATSTGTATTIDIKSGQLAAASDLVASGNTNDAKLATAGSIRSTILQAGNTAGGTITSNSDDTKVPTAKNVYQFVDATKLKAGGTAGGTITSSSDDSSVPTSKNVYEFVTSSISTAGANYQPKVETAEKFQVGWKTSGGTVGWKTLQEDDTTDATNYVTITQKPGTGNEDIYNINIPSALLSSSVSDALTPANSAKLVTAGVVYNLVDTTLAATGETNSTVPTSKAVVDYVAGFGIGGANTMPCTQANGKVCALVAYYDTTTSAIKYEWTIMAD